MTSVGGEGSTSNDDELTKITLDDKANDTKTNNGESSNDISQNSVPSREEKQSSSGNPFSSVPQVFGMGTGNREGLRLSLENNLSSGGGSSKSSSLMLTTPTFTSSNLSPGSLLLPPALLTPGTLNLLNTPTSSSVLGLVASSPAGAPTLTTPTLTPTTLRNIEQMFLEHDELGAGFGGSHSSESHENAAHFVPPPVAADDLSRSLKDGVPIKDEAPATTVPSSNTSIEDDSQKIDAAEVLNSIAQLTPNKVSNISPKPPTASLSRPSSLSLSSAANLLGPINPSQVPPPLTIIKPINGTQDSLGKPESLLGGDGKPSMASTVLAMASKATSSNSTAAVSAANAPAAPPSKPPPPPPSAAKQAQSPAAPTAAAVTSKPSTSGTTPSSSTPATKPETSAAVNSRRARHDSQASEASSSVSGVSSASSTVKKVEVAKKDLPVVVAANTVAKDSETGKKSVEENGDDELAGGTGVEGEDTMKNLRKTFAGIFGDIKQ